MATGGGAFKFYNKMKEVLHVDVVQEDEMECLIIGKMRCLILPAATDFHPDRARLFHHRNTPRSLHIQRRGTHAIR